MKQSHAHASAFGTRSVFLSLIAGSVIFMSGCGGKNRSLPKLSATEQATVNAVLAETQATIEAERMAYPTKIAEQWPVDKGAPDVTVTVGDKTVTFTGGYCRVNPSSHLELGGDGVPSFMLVSGDAQWMSDVLAGSLLFSGEGLQLTVTPSIRVFQVRLHVGQYDYLLGDSYGRESVGLPYRNTAFALSAGQESGTFSGEAKGDRSGGPLTGFVSISGSFACKQHPT